MEKWSQIVDFLEKSWIKGQLHIKFKKAQTLKKEKYSCGINWFPNGHAVILQRYTKTGTSAFTRKKYLLICKGDHILFYNSHQLKKRETRELHALFT